MPTRPHHFSRSTKAALWDVEFGISHAQSRCRSCLDRWTGSHIFPVGSKHICGVSGRRNAPFCCFFSCLQQKTQLALFYSALDPLFVLWFVSRGTALVTPVLVVTSGQQPGHLGVGLTWFGGGENDPNFSSQIWAKKKRENQQVQARPELIFGGHQPWPTGGISRREPCTGERGL